MNSNDRRNGIVFFESQRIAARRTPRPWRSALAAILVLTVLAACSAGTYYFRHQLGLSGQAGITSGSAVRSAATVASERRVSLRALSSWSTT